MIFRKWGGGGGSKAVWNFSENSSVLVWGGFPNTHQEILSGGREAYIYHVLSFQKAVKSRARVLELMYLCRGIIIGSFFSNDDLPLNVCDLDLFAAPSSDEFYMCSVIQ